MQLSPTVPEELPTPCLVIDRDRMGKTMLAMHELAMAAGKQLRPHAKSHKCPDIARLQREAGAIGICVATLDEAEAARDAGLEDVLLTTPLASNTQAARLARLAAGPHPPVAAVDSVSFIGKLDEALGTLNRTMNVLIDMDVGQGRTGCPIDQAPELAAAIDRASSLQLAGLQAYTGHLQHIHSLQERADASADCMQPAGDMFQQLRQMYPSCTTFSGGGTGTFHTDIHRTQLTELQVGSYVLMDAEYADLEVGDGQTLLDKLPPCLSLMTTVLSHRKKGAVVDCGLKAMYQDGAAPRPLDPAWQHLRYEWFGDAFGLLTGPEGAALPPIGQVVQLLVSHCDPTIALHSRYFACSGDEPPTVWNISLR